MSPPNTVNYISDAAPLLQWIIVRSAVLILIKEVIQKKLSRINGAAAAMSWKA
jgi:hypothetical protein